MSHTRYETRGDVAEIVIEGGPLNLWEPDVIAGVEDGVARTVCA